MVMGHGWEGCTAQISKAFVLYEGVHWFTPTDWHRSIWDPLIRPPEKNWMVCGAAETPLGRPGKGQSVPCKKTGASKLWRFAADKIDCTGRIYSPSRSQVRQLESLIVSEAMVGAFPRFFGRKDPLAKRPHFFRQIISSWFFEVFKGELRHFEVWDGTVLPPNKLQCLFQTPHRQHMLSDS